MRSKYADEFNHDDSVIGYDEDVLNEEIDPIRAGYEECLQWVIAKGQINANDAVLDLGSGTGNLSKRIESCSALTCVDVSAKMTEVAKPKLAHIKNLEFVLADVLEYFDADVPQYDVILSTYTIHHLLEDEKQLFFQKIFESLKPGGRAVFGDLMLESEASTQTVVSEYESRDQRWVSEAIQEEFFWYVDTAVEGLSNLGFSVELKRFSDLSWGIAASKPL